MKLRLITAAMLTAWGAPALASHVYLECDLYSNSGNIAYAVTLNEKTSSVTYKFDGGGQTTEAIFTPDTVSWLDGRFTIDRKTLHFTYQMMSYPGKPLGGPEYGLCRVADRKNGL